eukprot:4223654-Ditylum_brightwellii.AAC.1
MHSLKDKEDKKDYDLRRVPTITCELKYAPFVAKNLFLAFSNNPPARFMTKGTNLRDSKSADHNQLQCNNHWLYPKQFSLPTD